MIALRLSIQHPRPALSVRLGLAALATVALVAAGLVGCAAEGGPVDPGGDEVGSIQGTVYAPNGETPVAGARVWVPAAGALARQGTVAETTTDALGRFTLQNLPAGTVNVNVAKGSWATTFTATVMANQVTNVPAAETTMPATGEGALRIAVFQGAFDHMEDVLAKLGFGEVDEWGVLVPGTETFDLYSYDELASIFADLAQMQQYDLIFLDCGADEDPLWNDLAATVANVRAYVEGGGRLYATDLTYDYVEQAFPAAIDFVGSDGTPADEPEELSEAELGIPDIEADATVLDSNLRGWLAGRGALQGDSTVHITGFASGWAVINAVGPGTKSWIEGSVTYGWPAETEVRPLTVTFEAGDGLVLYTSYHTAEGYEGTTPTELLPQEQVLAYLAFELF